MTELFTLSDHIWVDDLGNEAKSICIMCYADIPHFVFLAMTESMAKIVLLSHQQNFSHVPSSRKK
jgi:hypothetical protein